MKTRGEQRYINLPAILARFYDKLTNIRGINQSFEEISDFIGTCLKEGKLLDVGTGPGRLIIEISKKNPLIELYGIDISESMLAIARKNIRSVLHVDLRTGNISKTDYDDGFFDCIVSTGSFYNWDNPVEALDEIFRILKPGSTAYIFESRRDYDKNLLKKRLKQILKGYSFFRKRISTFFLKKQLAMTYSLAEFEGLISHTRFSKSYVIREVELGNLPVFVRMELTKK
jgi:ubiquinone/menaquinone biosynthesis C-methylase UbiE